MSHWEEDENSDSRYSEELDNMDASVFSGEILWTNLNEFEWFVRRWQKAIDEHKNMVDDDR